MAEIIYNTENREMDVGSRQRIFCIIKVLWERTDEEHPISTNQLIKILKDEYSIPSHRNTITKDIKLLKQFGFDIVTIVSTQNKYFIGERLFEMPELRVLIDAVESSNLITAKKTKALIKKLHALASINQVKDLLGSEYPMLRNKTDNENIYYIVAAINDAMKQGKKIAFQYYDYAPDKEKVLRNDGELFKLSPYKFIWIGQKYYIVGYSDKDNKVVNYRVDRIKVAPDILKEDIVPVPEDVDIEKYAVEVYFMGPGERIQVDFKCDNSCMNDVIDWFGEEAQTEIYDENSFLLHVPIKVSARFLGWLFGFNGKITILGPENVKNMYMEMLNAAKSALE